MQVWRDDVKSGEHPSVVTFVHLGKDRADERTQREDFLNVGTEEGGERAIEIPVIWQRWGRPKNAKVWEDSSVRVRFESIQDIVREYMGLCTRGKLRALGRQEDAFDPRGVVAESNEVLIHQRSLQVQRLKEGVNPFRYEGRIFGHTRSNRPASGSSSSPRSSFSQVQISRGSV